MTARRSVVLWLVYGALIATPFLTRHAIPGTNLRSSAGALIIGVLIGLTWLVITRALFVLADRLPFRQGRWAKPALAHLVLFLACASMQAAAFAGAALVVAGGPPINIEEIFWSSGELVVIAYGTIAFVTFILDSAARTQAAELQLANAHAVAAEARLHALRSQLQPHFLFNALNTVAMAVRRADRQEALAVVLDLSALLRTALKRTGTELVSLTEEVDFIKQYLEIEQIRFRDRLNIDWAVDAAAYGAAVPSMILQPLVENAVRHGVGRKVRGGHVRIRITLAAERLRIDVEDDGPGFPEQWNAGVGLTNVRNRVTLHFGERASLETSGAGEGGRVTLSIPYITLNGNAEVHAADRR